MPCMIQVSGKSILQPSRIFLLSVWPSPSPFLFLQTMSSFLLEAIKMAGGQVAGQGQPLEEGQSKAVVQVCNVKGHGGPEEALWTTPELIVVRSYPSIILASERGWNCMHRSRKRRDNRPTISVVQGWDLVMGTYASACGFVNTWTSAVVWREVQAAP